jgi:hypothetical protein
MSAYIPVMLTMSEAARTLDVNVSRLRRAVARGEVVPLGRAGHSVNAPLLFGADQLPDLQRALSGEAP